MRRIAVGRTRSRGFMFLSLRRFECGRRSSVGSGERRWCSTIRRRRHTGEERRPRERRMLRIHLPSRSRARRDEQRESSITQGAAVIVCRQGWRCPGRSRKMAVETDELGCGDRARRWNDSRAGQETHHGAAADRVGQRHVSCNTGC
jgi:hypothetical protein